MKRLFVASVLLGIVLFLIGSVPCQADDEWSQLCTYKTPVLAVDSPYIYIVTHDHRSYPESTINRRPVYRSTDDGANWSLRYLNLCSMCWPTAVSIDPVDPDIVFSGVRAWNEKSYPNSGVRSPFRPKLYRSTDGGSNWTLVDNPECGVEGGDIPSIVSNPDDSSIVFRGRVLPGVGECDCPVRRSTDRGVNWATKSADLTDEVTSLAFDLDDPDILYAGTEDSGVFKTTNASAVNPDWDQTGLTNKQVRSVVVNPSNTSILYAATTDDVWKSTDGGTSWDSIAGDHDYTFNSLALNPKHPNILYALRDDDHVYFYYDGRSSDWVDMTSGLPSDDINYLVSDLDASGCIVVYAATDSGVYKHEEDEDKEFIRGDAKADDGNAGIVDLVFLYYYLYQNGPAPPCMDAADVNDDGGVTVADLVYLNDFIFSGGNPPPPPYGPFPDSCGTDPTSDNLNCIYSPCYGQ